MNISLGALFISCWSCEVIVTVNPKKKPIPNVPNKYTVFSYLKEFSSSTLSNNHQVTQWWYVIFPILRSRIFLCKAISNAGAFWRKRIERKNWVPLEGEGAPWIRRWVMQMTEFEAHKYVPIHFSWCPYNWIHNELSHHYSAFTATDPLMDQFTSCWFHSVINSSCVIKLRTM